MAASANPLPRSTCSLNHAAFNRLSEEGNRFDVLWRAIDTGAPYTVHARLNATAVQLKTEAFISQAIAIAVIVTLLITLGAVFLITPTVLVPFARLRQTLGLSPHIADSAADEWREVHESVIRRNAPPRIDGPALEERVEERTATLRSEIQRLKDAEGKLVRLAALTESASTPILRVSQEGVVLYANEPARELLDRLGAAIGGKLPGPWIDRIAGFLERGVSGEIEEAWGERTYALNIVPAASGDAVNIYGYDVTQRKVTDAARVQAGQGAFAGVNGRAVLEERLNHALAMWRSTGEGGTLFLVEIHDFEQMAASVDHSATNDLMRDIMARLRSVAGSEDGVIRFSRARFAIVREGIREDSPDENRAARKSTGSDPATAMNIAESLLATMNAPFHNGTQTIRVDASVGITLYPEDATDAEQLIRNGLMALDHAISEGPNQLRFFVARLNEEVHKRHSLTADLRQALRNNDLTLQYQARLSLRTCRIAGAEALVRWQRGDELLLPLWREAATWWVWATSRMQR